LGGLNFGGGFWDWPGSKPRRPMIKVRPITMAGVTWYLNIFSSHIELAIIAVAPGVDTLCGSPIRLPRAQPLGEEKLEHNLGCGHGLRHPPHLHHNEAKTPVRQSLSTVNIIFL
jgi:hypothetical protein